MLNEKILNNVRFRKVDYPGININQYFISENGELYNSITDKIIYGTITLRGYKQFRIDGSSYKAHRLVAYAFVEKDRDIQLTVDHLDGNKLNNHYTNLEWVTSEENLKRAFKSGLLNISSLTFYPDELVHKICEMYEQYNYSPIELYRIIRGTNQTPRGNKIEESFYRFLVSLRKKETRTDIANLYNYNPAEELDIQKMPGRNSIFSVDQIEMIAELYLKGKRVGDIIKMFNIEHGDPKYLKYYSNILRIVQRKSWTNITDKIFGDKEIQKPTRETNGRFSDEQVHMICQYIKDGDNPSNILSKMGYFKNHPDYKRLYEIIGRITNGRVYSSISKNYFEPRPLADRKDYNLNKELIFNMVAHGYSMKEICRVYGMKKKSDNPNLYRSILQQSSKFKKLNKIPELTFEELQDLMINEWAATW